jgi:hypothetical protein
LKKPRIEVGSDSFFRNAVRWRTGWDYEKSA